MNYTPLMSFPACSHLHQTCVKGIRVLALVQVKVCHEGHREEEPQHLQLVVGGHPSLSCRDSDGATCHFPWWAGAPAAAHQQALLRTGYCGALLIPTSGQPFQHVKGAVKGWLWRWHRNRSGVPQTDEYCGEHWMDVPGSFTKEGVRTLKWSEPSGQCW